MGKGGSVQQVSVSNSDWRVVTEKKKRTKWKLYFGGLLHLSGEGSAGIIARPGRRVSICEEADQCHKRGGRKRFEEAESRKKQQDWMECQQSI